MTAGTDASSGFWVVCVGPEDFEGPLCVGLGGSGEAVAVFSFEEEAMLYLRLEGREDDFRPIRVSGARLLALLSERWSGFGSVALDPIPKGDFGDLLPLTATSRERFARFLVSRDGGKTATAS